MVLTINPSKFDDFVLDDNNEMHAPRYFQEAELMELSKKIILIIAKYYLQSNEIVIKGATFHKLIDEEEIEFDKKAVKAILELQENDYFEMSI